MGLGDRDDLGEMLASVNELVESLMNSSGEYFRRDDVIERINCMGGLESHAVPYDFWASDYMDGWVAIRAKDRRMFDYYGGFEYTDRDCVTIVGNYVFYSGECERVNDLLDDLFSENEED